MVFCDNIFTGVKQPREIVVKIFLCLCVCFFLYASLHTLIRFGKFEEITVLMAKTCNFDSDLSDFNSVDLKKTQKINY